MNRARHSEFAFETVIESHLLANGYVTVDRQRFDCDRAIFPEEALGFIRATQPNEWKKLEALHGEKTGEQILADLCKWVFCTPDDLQIDHLRRSSPVVSPSKDGDFQGRFGRVHRSIEFSLGRVRGRRARCFYRLRPKIPHSRLPLDRRCDSTLSATGLIRCKTTMQNAQRRYC
jgi:hypothetical protein